MPELPEVETIRRHLAPHVEGRVAAAPGDPRPALVASDRARRAVGRAGGPARRAHSAGAASTSSPSSRARPFLLMHLRMTGTLLLVPRRRRHERVHFDLDDGTRLVFADPRRFGTGELALGDAALRRLPRRAPRPRALRPRPSPPQHLRRLARRCARAGQGVPARSEARSPGSATSTPTRRCTAPASTRSGSPSTLRPAQTAALRDAVVAVARATGSRPRARRSTTSGTPTASRAPSRTSSSCIAARASRARLAGPVRSSWGRARDLRLRDAASRGRASRGLGGAAAAGREPPPRGAARAALDERVAPRRQFLVPADGLAVDDDLGERHHPGPLCRARPGRRRPWRG